MSYDLVLYKIFFLALLDDSQINFRYSNHSADDTVTNRFIMIQGKDVQHWKRGKDEK